MAELPTLVFAILLRAMRQTTTLVFIDTQGGVRGRFVGLASTEQTRWALARAYPWLEADYAEAYATATAAERSPNPDTEAFVTDHRGQLTHDSAHRVATWFVFAVQAAPPATALGAAPPGWVEVQVPGAGSFNEHAVWLTGAELERVMGPALHRFAYIREDRPRAAAAIGREALGLEHEDAVALVDDQHRFSDRVVDRRQALETIAGTSLTTKEPILINPDSGGTGIELRFLGIDFGHLPSLAKFWPRTAAGSTRSAGAQARPAPCSRACRRQCRR